MIPTGYRWAIVQDGDVWRWRAHRQADGAALAAGKAGSRAQAAAAVARAIAFGVVADQSA